MRSALIRAGRTFLQTFIGTLLASGIIQGVSDSGAIPDWSAIQTVLYSAFASGLVGLLSWAQNALEVSGRSLGIPRD